MIYAPKKLQIALIQVEQLWDAQYHSLEDMSYTNSQN